MANSKAIYRKLYFACFAILVVCILLCCNHYLNELSNDFFVELQTSNDFENIHTGIIYFGRPSCPECRTIDPIIRSIAREEKIKIYYFDTEYIRTTEGIDRSVLQKYLLEYQVETVPTIIVMSGGVVVESIGETWEYDSARKVSLISALTPYKNMINNVTSYSAVSRWLLGISVLCILISLVLPKAMLSKRLYLPIASFDICVVFCVIRSWGVNIGYIEKIGYSGNKIDSIIALLAIAAMLFSTAFFVIRIKEKLSDSE